MGLVHGSANKASQLQKELPIITDTAIVCTTANVD